MLIWEEPQWYTQNLHERFYIIWCGNMPASIDGRIWTFVSGMILVFSLIKWVHYFSNLTHELQMFVFLYWSLWATLLSTNTHPLRGCFFMIPLFTVESFAGEYCFMQEEIAISATCNVLMSALPHRITLHWLSALLYNSESTFSAFLFSVVI